MRANSGDQNVACFRGVLVTIVVGVMLGLPGTIRAADKSNIDALADSARGALKADVKGEAFNKLLAIDDPHAAEMVIDILKDDAILVTSSKLRSPDSGFVKPAKAHLVPLLKLFRDLDQNAGGQNWWVIARILGMSGDDRASNPMIAALRQATSKASLSIPDAEVCCYALADLRSPSTVQALTAVLHFQPAKGNVGHLWGVAGYAIWHVGTEGARKVLSNELLSPAAFAILPTIQAGDPSQAIPCLIDGLAAPYRGDVYAPGYIPIEPVNMLIKALQEKVNSLPPSSEDSHPGNINSVYLGGGSANGATSYQDGDLSALHNQWHVWWGRYQHLSAKNIDPNQPATRPQEADEVDALVARIKQRDIAISDIMQAANRLLSIKTPYAAASFVRVIPSIPPMTNNGFEGDLSAADTGGLGLTTSNQLLVEPLIKFIDDEMRKPQGYRAELGIPVYLLGQLKDKRALPSILKALAACLNRSESFCPVEYAWALGEFRDPSAVRLLTLASKDGSILDRCAFDALCRIGTPAAFHAVGNQLINSTRIMARHSRAALMALSVSNDDLATSELIEALPRKLPSGKKGVSKMDLDLKVEILQALTTKTGHPEFGTNVAKWRAWLQQRQRERMADHPTSAPSQSSTPSDKPPVKPSGEYGVQ